MKIKKLTIEAQQICLQEVTQVFDILANKLAAMEENNLITEATISLASYNSGYRIETDYRLNWESEEAREKNMPSFIPSSFLQPSTFFEDDMVEGKRAYMEYGNIKKDRQGHSTGRADVINMGQFKTYAAAWTEGMIKQIEEL